jgi:protein involved in polysaccharide export with SLBB domain
MALLTMHIKGPAKRRGFHAAFWTHVLAGTFALMGAAGVHAADNEYKLGPQDKVRLKVFEWRASRDEVYEWTALNDEFVVGPGGKLALPFVGEVAAAGLSTGEVARIVADRMRTRMGMADAPDATVEIVTFRPIYVSGHVGRPGEYAFRPGLTVIQAVTIAEGVQRTSGTRLERDVISGRGDLRVMGSELLTLQLRKARLEAELKGASTIEFPAQSGNSQDSNYKLIVRQENSIFDARRKAFDTQLAALQQLREYLEKEVVSVEAQVKTGTRQMELIQKELQGVVTLVDKGYAVAQRQLLLERAMAQAEGDQLRLGSTVMRAKQEISRTDISILELKNRRDNDITVELRETQSRIDAYAERIETAKGLLYEAEVVAPQVVGERGMGPGVTPTYTVARAIDGRVTKIVAEEGTPVLPGDTIQVRLIPSSAEDVAPSRRSQLVGSAEAGGSTGATR